jgi:hypothetical protein
LFFLHERDWLHEGNAATDLYLDPNVEKTIVVVRIMPLIRRVRGLGFPAGDHRLDEAITLEPGAGFVQ